MMSFLTLVLKNKYIARNLHYKETPRSILKIQGAWRSMRGDFYRVELKKKLKLKKSLQNLKS